MSAAPAFDRLWADATACGSRGDAEGAILALHRALLLRREDFHTQQTLCRLVAEHRAAFSRHVRPAIPPVGRPVSVVVCSIDAAKYARVESSYARAFGAARWEMIGIHDAASLAEGYARGLARARGEWIVFSHDDIEILSADLGGALASAFAELDVVGIVGTTKLTGPGHAWGGRAYTRGRVAEPTRSGQSGVDLVVFNPAPGITTGLDAIDGVFMAATREAAEGVGFDAATFDGFHLYDLDFSHRARLSGRRVGLSSGIVLRHDSEGRFDARWEAYARRFAAKFADVRGERAENFMSRIRFPDATALLDYCERLDAAGRRALALEPSAA